MARLNFHHLHYFWAVAKEGHLTRAAQRLHVSQSALSAQIKLLEEQLGAGAVRARGAAAEADRGRAGRARICRVDLRAGQELLALLKDGRRAERQVLRVGAVATLSRNFQENFLRPLLARDDVELVLQSGSLGELLPRLRVHTLDLVLANRAVTATADEPWRCRRIARQPVSLVGPKRRKPLRSASPTTWRRAAAAAGPRARQRAKAGGHPPTPCPPGRAAPDPPPLLPWEGAHRPWPAAAAVFDGRRQTRSPAEDGGCP
jgi:DNA-binding transcriptional LysR family regulator